MLIINFSFDLLNSTDYIQKISIKTVAENIYDFLTLFIYANVLREKGETGKKDEWDERIVIRPSKEEYHRWLSIRFVGQMQIENF